MQEFLTKLATCNKEANLFVKSILDTLSIEERSQDHKSYYKSLDGLFSHIVSSMAYFGGIFHKALPNEHLSKSYNLETITEQEWINLSEELDNNFCSFVVSLSHEDLLKSIDFHGSLLTVADIILIVSRHGDHHRGQMSQILDAMGVNHDMLLLKK